jgi:hypothetical protein
MLARLTSPVQPLLDNVPKAEDDYCRFLRRYTAFPRRGDALSRVGGGSMRADRKFAKLEE